MVGGLNRPVRQHNRLTDVGKSTLFNVIMDKKALSLPEFFNHRTKQGAGSCRGPAPFRFKPVTGKKRESGVWKGEPTQ